MIDLKRFIRDKKITQEALALILNCKQSYISKLVNNKDVMSDEMFAKFKNIYGDIVDKYIQNIPNIVVKQESIGVNNEDKVIYEKLIKHLEERILDKDEIIESLKNQIRLLELLHKKTDVRPECDAANVVAI